LTCVDEVIGTRVGLALSIAACCGILSPLPFGRIADRVHPARL
jgi:hypothetical protein